MLFSLCLPCRVERHSPSMSGHFIACKRAHIHSSGDDSGTEDGVVFVTDFDIYKMVHLDSEYEASSSDLDEYSSIPSPETWLTRCHTKFFFFRVAQMPLGWTPQAM